MEQAVTDYVNAVIFQPRHNRALPYLRQSSTEWHYAETARLLDLYLAAAIFEAFGVPAWVLGEGDRPQAVR